MEFTSKTGTFRRAAHKGHLLRQRIEHLQVEEAAEAQPAAGRLRASTLAAIEPSQETIWAMNSDWVEIVFDGI